ncbi:MAG: L-lactate dehydrogenase [Faecalibacterium sp.]|jgi:L-lactate dehydrogenase|nr:L-lactate dehydrogenase [Faecalibacterium sp.]
MLKQVNYRKIAIVGCGFVGATCAYTLMQHGLFSEMVLIDIDQARAEGEAMDISHGLLFASPMNIYAGTYADTADAGMVIVTAGANQKPGETRLDLVKKNTAIFRSMLPQLMGHGFHGVLLIVANPVDILTHVAQQLSGLPEQQVFGSGTVLDTARMRYLLGERLSVDTRSVHAFIIGEHGDSEIPVWSSANVSGVPLHDFCEMRGFYEHEKAMREIGESVKNSAYEIIARKKATYYGIGMAVERICEAVVRDEKSILPVSTALHGELGIAGVTFSVPAIVGADGIERIVPIALDETEQTKLRESAAVLQDTLAQAAENSGT